MDRNELARLIARRILDVRFPREIQHEDAARIIREWHQRPEAVGLFLMDMAGRGTYHDERWSLSTGVDTADAEGCGWRKAYVQDDVSAVCEAEANAIIEGKAFSAPACIAKTGQRIIARGAPVLKDGEPLYFVGILMPFL